MLAEAAAPAVSDPGAAAAPSRTGAVGLVLHTVPGAVGSVLVVITLLAITVGPWLSPHDAGGFDMGAAFQEASGRHWLGTDQMGRDLLVRIMAGGRLSLLVGLGTVLLGIGVGVPLGLLSGAAGGKLDAVIMRAVDIVLAVPALIVALAVIAVLGPGVINITVAIGLRSIPIYARIARAEVIGLMARDFVQSARALGARPGRILWRHLLPNLAGSIVAISGLRMATGILTAASLTFLGLGVPPGEAEWGAMINEAKQYIRVHPHLVTYPGVAIMLSVLGFNLVGDALQDAINPRVRARIRSAGTS
jgi:ABC-type dipeptide/oligopeptide/nickel transport system permease subunit